MSLERISTFLHRKNFVFKGKKPVFLKEKSVEKIVQEVLRNLFSEIEGVEVHVYQGSCFISSPQPAFLNEVFMRQNEILEQVNKKLGKNILENIYCRASTK